MVVDMMRVATKVVADAAAIFMGGLIFDDLRKETVKRIMAVVARAVNIATPHDRSPRFWVGGEADLVDLSLKIQNIVIEKILQLCLTTWFYSTISEP